MEPGVVERVLRIILELRKLGQRTAFELLNVAGGIEKLSNYQIVIRFH